MENPDLTYKEYNQLKKKMLPHQKVDGFVRLLRTLEDGTVQVAVPTEGGYKFIDDPLNKNNEKSKKVNG